MADTNFVSGTTITKEWLNSIDDLKYPPSNNTPTSNNEITFQLTSNTQLTIKVKGLDGIVRSVSLTLV